MTTLTQQELVMKHPALVALNEVIQAAQRTEEEALNAVIAEGLTPPEEITKADAYLTAAAGNVGLQLAYAIVADALVRLEAPNKEGD